MQMQEHLFDPKKRDHLNHLSVKFFLHFYSQVLRDNGRQIFPLLLQKLQLSPCLEGWKLKFLHGLSMQSYKMQCCSTLKWSDHKKIQMVKVYHRNWHALL